jgi:uncharacterized protein involved in exopolysaccharide biosynthesis
MSRHYGLNTATPGLSAMRRYLDTARRYVWIIAVIFAITLGSGAVAAYVEYVTTFESSATLWAERAQRDPPQFVPEVPRDPGFGPSLVTPAAEQGAALNQLLQTRGFVLRVAELASLAAPTDQSEERKFVEDVRKRFKVEELGTNVMRISYRARDPQTAPAMVKAALAARAERIRADRDASALAAKTVNTRELEVAQERAAAAQRALDAFNDEHVPPMSAAEDYARAQLRAAADDAQKKLADLKATIDRSSIMPVILQMADQLDLQMVDEPRQENTPSGGTRSAQMLILGGALAGFALVCLLIFIGTLLSDRVDGAADVARLTPAMVFASVPEVARSKGRAAPELRRALAAVAFANPSAEHGRGES